MSGTDTEYVLVTEYFHPDTAATGQLMTDLAVGLEERGLDMTIVTGQPNYHSGENGKQPRVSTHKGVTVKRIRAPQVRQSSLARRLFNWFVFTAWVSLVLLISRQSKDRELIFVSNPPFLPIPLWMVCTIRGWEYTHIVHDFYPDFLVEISFFQERNPIVYVWRALYQRVLRDAQSIVALGPRMRERIIDVAGDGIDPEKVVIVHNWADGEFITPIPKHDNWFSQNHDLVDKLTLLYSGNIGENHDLESIVRAAAALDDTRDIKFVIIGEGDNKEEIVELASKLDIPESRIQFLPYQPLKSLPYSLTAGDISIVTVREGMEGVCVSSKLYTALAAGKPVLVVAGGDDDESEVIKQFQAGIQAQPGEVRGILNAVESWHTNPELLDTQGENARQAFEEFFTKSKAIDRYFEILSEGDQPEPHQIPESPLEELQEEIVEGQL